MDKKQIIVIVIFATMFILLLTLLFLNNSSNLATDESSVAVDSVSRQETVVEDTAVIVDEYVLSDREIALCTTIISDTIPQKILRRKAYIVSYNDSTKLPNWVAWHLLSEHTDGQFPRLGNFHEDEDLDYPRATIYDYRGSGWTRGHMCPAGDNKWSQQAMYESFALSNVCPQNANLNSGLWNSIEIDCRKWANKFDDIYIVCGPLYLRQEHEIIGENAIIVPEAFFKVVLCLNGTPKAFGFIVRNTDGNSKRDLYYNSVDQVERITGYDFFSSLPDEIEDVVEANADINDWRK